MLPSTYIFLGLYPKATVMIQKVGAEIVEGHDPPPQVMAEGTPSEGGGMMLLSSAGEGAMEMTDGSEDEDEMDHPV